MKINGSLRFDSSGLSEIQNLRIEKIASVGEIPTWGSSDVGRVIFVTATSQLYVGGASSWISVATGGDASALQTEVNAIEASLGTGVQGDGTFLASAFPNVAAAAGIAPTSFTDAIEKIATFASGKDALSELVDVDLNAPAAGELLQYNGTDWANSAIGAESGVQEYSVQLDGITALSADTGIVVKTDEGVFGTRELVAPAAGLTISNNDGFEGNPTFALANDLAALEGLAGTGFAVRTGADTWTNRSLATASADRVTVANPDGVSGSPTIDLATVTDSGAGTFLKVTVDAYGRVTGTQAVATADVTALVDSTYVNVTGDTMSGNLVFSSGTVTGVPSPSADTEVANKAYVDAVAAGKTWKNAVKAASTGNLTLSGEQTIDGVALVAGDRILVKDQTTASENGLYVVAAGAWARASDADAAAELSAAAVFVTDGTLNADTGWVQTATVSTLGTDAVTFAQFSGSSTYTWGTGLSATGNTVNVNLGAGIAQLPTDEVGVDLYASATSALILTTDGTARSTDTAAQLKLLSGAGLTQDATGLYIGAAQVTNTMLANSTITLDGDGAGTGTIALGATLTVNGDAVQGIVTDVGAGSISITASDASVSQKGVASFDTNHFSVTAGAVSLAASLDDLTNVSTADAAATGTLLTKSATDWVPVSRADLFAGESIDALSDVTLSAPAAGQTLVYDGSAFVNRAVYFLYDGSTAAATHTVTHNLGQKYCNVTVVDSTDNVVIPESIVFGTANQLTVTFNTSIACKVIVMGV
jgi:hypothetical protein